MHATCAAGTQYGPVCYHTGFLDRDLKGHKEFKVKRDPRGRDFLDQRYHYDSISLCLKSKMVVVALDFSQIKIATPSGTRGATILFYPGTTFLFRQTNISIP